MAITHNLPILGGATNPRANVSWEPGHLNLNTVNARFQGGLWLFPDTATRDKLDGEFRVPGNYVGTGLFVARFACVQTSGNVLFKLNYKAIADAEAGDPSTDDEDLSFGSVAVPGTARLDKEITVSATSANFVVGDRVPFSISRDGVNESSGVAGTVYLKGLWFRYNDG